MSDAWHYLYELAQNSRNSISCTVRTFRQRSCNQQVANDIQNIHRIHTYWLDESLLKRIQTFILRKLRYIWFQEGSGFESPPHTRDHYKYVKIFVLLIICYEMHGNNSQRIGGMHWPKTGATYLTVSISRQGSSINELVVCKMFDHI